MEYTFECMTDEHRRPVIDILNYYIEHSFAAYPDSAVGYGVFEHFLGMSRDYPAVVAKTGSGDVVGFAFLHSYRPAPVFGRTAQVSYFILPGHTRNGLGKRILERFVHEARKLGVDNLLADISSLNTESISFHRQHGFEECGRFRDVGFKRGRSFDVVWVQRRI